MGGRPGAWEARLFVRPLLLLVAGVAAGGVAWWVLMHEPPQRPGRRGAVELRLPAGDRLALGSGTAWPAHRREAAGR